MKIKQGYILRKALGENILINISDDDAVTNGIIALDEVGVFIYEHLDGQRSLADIAALITEEYDVSFETALKDAEEFAEKLLTLGVVE